MDADRSPIQFEARQAALLSFLARSPGSFSRVEAWLPEKSEALRVARVIAGLTKNERSPKIRATAAFFSKWAEEYADDRKVSAHT